MKQHAREPGDLQHAFACRGRPVREGHKPQCGHVRGGEVTLRHSTSEPAEQRSKCSGGGWGGKGADEGEHRAAKHAPDTERQAHVPGAERCAKSSKGKKAGTVHFLAPPSERRSAP